LSNFFAPEPEAQQMGAMPRGTKIQRRILLAALILVPLALGACWLRGYTAKRSGQATPPAASQRLPAVFEVGEAIYDGGLKAGWEDRSLSRRELLSGQPARVSFGSFGGLMLHHEPLGPSFGALVFRFKAPETFLDFLSVSLTSAPPAKQTFPSVAVTSENITPLADGWREVSIPFRALNPAAAPFDGVALRARRMVGDEMVSIDNLVLTKADSGAAPAVGAPARRNFVTLDCRAQARAISPLIYGIAQGVVSSGETAHRIGGNAMTRLNWDLGNVWNTGSDWFFENVKGDDAGLPFWLSEAQAAGLQMGLTVPMIGWVAKDSTSSGFPRSKFGPQRKYDQYRPEAGDGFSPAGKPLAPLPPTQTSEPAPPERIQRWVEAIVERDRKSGKRSVQQYMLDNEPDLWHLTHRDVHPEPLTYDELLDRTLRYGGAVRRADPEAIIAGPTSWGWTGYFFSAKDNVAGAMLQPDRRAHGGEPLLAWYLRKLAEHERATGERILDVLDVHYYPQAQHVHSPNADPETAALRLRSTRSLWDPSYVDESWIKESVRLLPRLQEWVDKNYPGRRISLGEWSFGGEQHISGGLATAEALGRFGQHGLYSAFYWNKPPPGSPAFWGFRAFRNYDGKGSSFLELSVRAASTKQVSVFASRDPQSSRFVLVLLNLDPTHAALLDFDVSSCGPLERSRTFSYRGDSAGFALEPQSGNGLAGLTLAPYSIGVIELSKR
jgi:hypothetical protein